MKNILKELERYLQETMSISTAPLKWEGAGRVPFFLRDLYAFFQVNLFNTQCLLMVERGQTDQTPANIRKHLMLLQEKWDGEVIYIAPTVSAYNRKRLIEQRVPFIVPGNQLYLPMLGMDFREHFKTIRSKSIKLSPSTQAVVLYGFLRGKEESYTPSGLANRLGYTTMTLTRAFNELEVAGLGEVGMEGRERILRFTEKGKHLWEKARELLKSPVKKRIWIEKPRGNWRGIQAGLTALAHYTMLAAPQMPVYAISQEDWKTAKKPGDFFELPGAESGAYEIEVWSYSPRLFSDTAVVDRLSLYLSLQEHTDERVEAALGEMLGAMAW